MPAQKPLLSGDPATQCRVFDMLYNLSIHGELLYDTAAEAVPEDAPVLAEAGGARSADVHVAPAALPGLPWCRGRAQ